MWTLAIAAVTGGTAVLASWVTGRGSTQAARIQAEIAARSQRAERLRESRRTAYLDLIEQTHHMGELFWEISAALRLPGSPARTTALGELRERELAEYAKIRRCARVVELEGPPSAAAAALALQQATAPFYAAMTADLSHDATAVTTPLTPKTSTPPSARSGRRWRTSWMRRAPPISRSDEENPPGPSGRR